LFDSFKLSYSSISLFKSDIFLLAIFTAEPLL